MRILLVFLICIGIVRCADLSTVRFLLWTRSNPQDDEYYDLKWKDSISLAASPFNGNKKTHFSFHGWGSKPMSSYIIGAKSALLELEDINFISVDWERLAGCLIYEPSVKNMYEVSNYTAQFIDYLVDEAGLDTSSVHSWGFSLGAQAAGVTGNYVQSGLIGRVTSLDPAGPSFFREPIERRVNNNSALFVDVIHTHGGKQLDEGKMAMYEPLGHADFYPNGGVSQPGCGLEDTGIPELFTSCSHRRAAKYFVESISSVGGFVACPCKNKEEFEAGECEDCGDRFNYMGYYSDSKKHGTFYLQTNSEKPYAIELE